MPVEIVKDEQGYFFAFPKSKINFIKSKIDLINSSKSLDSIYSSSFILLPAEYDIPSIYDFE